MPNEATEDPNNRPTKWYHTKNIKKVGVVGDITITALSYKPIRIQDVNALYSDVKDSIRKSYHLLRFDNLFDLNYS